MPDFRVERGAVFAGPVQYHHNRRLGDHTSVSGITIGRLLVDVPARIHESDRAAAEREIAGRGGGRPSMGTGGGGGRPPATEPGASAATS